MRQRLGPARSSGSILWALKPVNALMGMALVVAWALLSTQPAKAVGSFSPLLQGVANISSPAPFARVRGNVSIAGTATHPQFLRYELYFAPEPGDGWVFIGEAHFNEVIDGLLGTWDTTALPDGTYSLLLRVVRQDGNYDEAYQRGLVVANQAPEQPTPAPTPAELPTLPAPVGGPTPTPTVELSPTAVAIQQPEIPTPTPRPSPSPTATPDGAAASADQAGDVALSLGDSFDTQSLRGAAATGLAYTGGAFLAVGMFFGVKKLLTWLWYLMAP